MINYFRTELKSTSNQESPKLLKKQCKCNYELQNAKRLKIAWRNREMYIGKIELTLIFRKFILSDFKKGTIQYKHLQGIDKHLKTS